MKISRTQMNMDMDMDMDNHMGTDKDMDTGETERIKVNIYFSIFAVFQSKYFRSKSRQPRSTSQE